MTSLRQRHGSASNPQRGYLATLTSALADRNPSRASECGKEYSRWSSLLGELRFPVGLLLHSAAQLIHSDSLKNLDSFRERLVPLSRKINKNSPVP